MSAYFHTCARVVFMLAVIYVYASNAHSEALTDQQTVAAQLTLSIKPGLCLRYAKGERCDVTVIASWFAPSGGERCLFSEVQPNSAIKCWRNTDEGVAEIDVSIVDDLRFWLSDSNGELVLVEKVLAIATVVKSQKRERHGRRHIWNLI